ncbi:MAG: SGNH/GDSL hydrolase family protein [Bacteroidota bacterium]
MNLKIGILIAVSLLLFACSKTIVEPATTTSETETTDNENEGAIDYRLLFVGNSLTYYNDLPKLVKEVAKSRDLSIATEMLAKGNYALIDHWADGQVQSLIRSKQYDFVIVQQGPSSLAESYRVLLEGGEKFDDLCKANDAQLAYFMVWPSRQYYHTFDGVIRNYTAAAAAHDAILCPVGQVWKRHFDATNDFSYYGRDGFHPAIKGSQVAARVIVDSLFP